VTGEFFVGESYYEKQKENKMNNQSPMNGPIDRREARRKRREDRRAALGAPSSIGTLTLGAILVLLGVAFLMQNMGTFSIPLKNWGALFILIPAFGAFDRAWRFYRNGDNQFTSQARGALFVGLMLTAVTIMILFELNWTFYGPLLIILVGVGILVNAVLPGR
jgi:peptidoglycan/LPS O-acetylase OafA/YrhL